VPNFIRIISVVIILLGIVHITFALPIQHNTENLWFIGSGVAIIFAGLLNMLAIHKGGSVFTHTVAVISNALMCTLFCFALLVLPEPQVYFGVFIFLVAVIAFVLLLGRSNK
jgi:hypothetical protein